MTEKIIKPIHITKENFSEFGDMISTKDIKPLKRANLKRAWNIDSGSFPNIFSQT